MINKKCLAAGLILSLVAGTAGGTKISKQTVKATTDYGLSNPRVEMLTRDVIEFGSYWQEDTNGDGVADQKDEKTPVKWQILSETDTDGDGKTDDLFLMADQVLDCKPYSEEYKDVTWETCTLRAWLNSDFYGALFTDEEKDVIKETELKNDNNNSYETEGGNDTKDYLFLLTESDIKNIGYMFSHNLSYSDQARQAKVTGNAKENGPHCDSVGVAWWWLRSPGNKKSQASYVNNSGSLSFAGGNNVDNSGGGIRPAMHVKAANATISSTLTNRMTKDVSLVKSTWDTVKFGNYNGTKILWRVLAVDGDDAFLLADQILLKKMYHKDYTTGVTWENSNLRKWLNNDFIEKAFSSTEQREIKTVTIRNVNNMYCGTEGGKDTTDEVFLLSIDDLINKTYGFSTACLCEDSSRLAVPTNSEEASWWWLRSPGVQTNYASYVNYNGFINVTGDYVNRNDSGGIDTGGVRPALHLNLSSSVWEKGEEVTSDDKKTAITDSLPNGDSSGRNDGSDETTGDDNGKNDIGNGGSTVGTNTNSGLTVDRDTNTNASNSVGNTSITPPSKVKSLKITNKKKGKTVLTYKKVSGAAGYQIQYAKNKKFTKGKKSKATKKTKYTIKKLTKKKTYYFRIRAYKIVSGDKKFGKWSAVKKLKIKK